MLNCQFEKYISTDAVDGFIRNLYRANCKWSNVFEYTKNYDYSRFSQKPSDGLEKYETIINGNTIIFSAISENGNVMYNLEITYNDEQEYIYEIPYLNNEDIKPFLNTLLDSIHKQHFEKYTKMNTKLFNLQI